MSNNQKKAKLVRCAIYTRKSTHEGLEQEFNSLHAQREACESYIASQKHAGWRLIQTNYDDGGFTGGNIERPALQQLLEDIHNGAIDCVVVYKVDRLSRSLLDFARMMQLFEKKDIGFISVTQNFDTTTSMGRLTLNILLSFAQFEREMISERTHDKLAAMRKKGKWLGGRPVLGYDVDVSNNHLTVNPKEKALVITIFKTYLETESTKATAELLNQQGHKTKKWKKKNNEIQRGKPFTATAVQSILRNPTYIGKSRYKGELYDGDHEPIIDNEIFNRVALILSRNRREGDTRNRSDQVYLLKGLLRCGHCDSAMTTSYSIKGSKKYRYYRCHSHHKNHNADCPNSILSAPKFEQEVLRYLNPTNHMGRFHQFDQSSIQALSKITEIWDVLFPRARTDIIRDLVKSVLILGNEDEVEIEIDFNMEGIQKLSNVLC